MGKQMVIIYLLPLYFGPNPWTGHVFANLWFNEHLETVLFFEVVFWLHAYQHRKQIYYNYYMMVWKSIEISAVSTKLQLDLELVIDKKHNTEQPEVTELFAISHSQYSRTKKRLKRYIKQEKYNNVKKIRDTMMYDLGYFPGCFVLKHMLALYS